MQILVNGIVSGLVAGLLAVAFGLVYFPTRVFFMALAGAYTLGPFVASQLRSAGFSWPIAVVVALLVPVLFCVACEQFNHRLIERRSASPGAHLVSSLGIYIVSVQAIALVWGNESKHLRAGALGSVALGSVSLTLSQLGGCVVSLATLAAFYTWLRFSGAGLQLRALGDNPLQLELFGHSTASLRLTAFGLAGLLAGVSSLLSAFDVGFDAQSGLQALLPAIVAAVLGGRGSFLAPALGGILLGVVRAESVWLLSGRWQETATFLVLAATLFFLPQGLVRSAVRLEAEK